jgi:riboflavin kinase / FMN adenylyltransferase
MQFIDHIETTWVEGQTVLTIGVFDGVHRGHQTLVRQVIESARRSGRRSGVVTFHPHPASVLAPEHPIRYLSTPAEKASLFAQMGVDVMALIPFTPELAQQPAEQFVEMIVDHLHPAEIWVGQDFALGHNREGDIESLSALGEHYRFSVHRLDPVVWDGAVVSSSRIRGLLAAGEMERVADLLGRHYSVTGQVVPGHQRGRQLGFPTANVDIPHERALPRDGIYACFATLNGERLPAASNLGVRPTFDETDRLLEVYLIDRSVDLYAQRLTVEFVHFLRPEQKFDSSAQLIAQMSADVDATRRLLAASRQFELQST